MRASHARIAVAVSRQASSLACCAAPSTSPVIIRPRLGLMVLFPSYFWHHTVPFTGDQERISVAFDIIAR